MRAYRTSMNLEELPEDLREMVESLRHGSNTIECDVNDALEAASDLDDFKERVLCELNSLVGEIQDVKKVLDYKYVQQMTITIATPLTPEACEKLEDKLKELLEKERLEATIDDLVTGNSTVTELG